MAEFLSAPVIKIAVQDLSSSSARGRYFEFLMLKRALKIAEADSVIFAEGEPAYKKAINELGTVSAGNYLDGQTGGRYINVFDTKDSSHGYRSGRFISNGPNTTIGGTAWQQIVQVDQNRPRKVRLSKDYLSHISKFLSLKTGNKPNYFAFAVWYHRHNDIEGLIQTENLIDFLTILAKQTDVNFGLTEEEKGILFDFSTDFYEGVASLNQTVLQSETATSSDYLPPIPGKDPGKLPRLNSLTVPVFSTSGPYQKIYFGAPGSGKSRRLSVDADGMKVFRTTFHPDSEYAGFVGTYKPFVIGTDIT